MLFEVGEHHLLNVLSYCAGDALENIPSRRGFSRKMKLAGSCRVTVWR